MSSPSFMSVNSLHSTPRVCNTVWCMRQQRIGVLLLERRGRSNKPINMYTNRHVNIVRMQFCGVIWQGQQQRTKNARILQLPRSHKRECSGRNAHRRCCGCTQIWSANRIVSQPEVAYLCPGSHSIRACVIIFPSLYTQRCGIYEFYPRVRVVKAAQPI